MRPNERKSFWPIIEELIIELGRKNRISRFKIFHDVADHLENNNNKRADHVIIDECQDIGPEILRMVRAMVDKTDNDIFMCGDLGQSLYHRHHSWLQHGIDVRGRSSVLRINYRTSRQIKDTADCLTNLRAITGDEEDEDRRSVSIFDGPSPILQLFDNQDADSDGAAQWISQQLSDGIEPHDLLVITRSSLQQRRAKTAVDRALELAGIENSGLWSLDAENNFHDGLVGYSSTERSKGLEYKAIAILACDEDLMPLLSNKKNFLDEEEEREWMELERNQLYVAMTRARDRLYISGIKPGSAFLRELGTLDT